MNEKIFEALDAQFTKHRILFWYDEEGKQRQCFDDYKNASVEKVELDNNEFAMKYHILKEGSPNRFLVYSPSAKPADEDNWLLDLNLQHFIFATNPVAEIIRELGIDPALEPVINKYLDFFTNRKERLYPLKVVLSQVSSHINEEDLCMAMLGVLASDTRVEREHSKSLRDMCIRLFRDTASEEPKGYWKQIEKFGLDPFFWKKIEEQFRFASTNPSIEAFLAFLFAKAFDYEVKQSVTPENRQSFTFIDSWRNNFDEMLSYTRLADRFEKELNISHQILGNKLDEMLDWDLFKACDRAFVQKLVDSVKKDTLSPRTGLEHIKRRKSSYWIKTDESGKLRNIYNCLEMFLLFSIALKKVDELPTTLQEIWKHYVDNLYLEDYYYRKFLEYFNRDQQSILIPLLNRIEKMYTNGYLSKISHLWQDKLKIGSLKNEFFPSQRDFFRRYVQPYISQGKNIFVICSDALRYEVAKELAERLEKENRIKIETDAMVASIPSYTQLGMASLLPHKQVEVDLQTLNVIVDGISSAGLEGRNKVLESYFAASFPEMKAKAIDARWFMNLPLRRQEEEIEGYQCIYVYSGHIDSTGDNAKTATSLPEAVDVEIKFLIQLTKKIINLNRTHILITADHGFLFQYKPLEETDQILLDQTDGECKRDRRFIIGRDLPNDNRFMSLSSGELNLQGDFQVQIPKGLVRIRKQGAGSRYVHGGMTIHELCVPVLKVRKTRADDVREVSFAIMSKSTTITTNQIAVNLFQEEPVSAKVQGRKITLRFESTEGKVISNQRDIVFDSSDPNAQNRTQVASFVFSREIESYNAQTIYLCFYQKKYEEMVPIRDSAPYRLQISITPDF